VALASTGFANPAFLLLAVVLVRALRGIQSPEGENSVRRLRSHCSSSLYKAHIRTYDRPPGEKYREWLVDQEGDEIKMIGCFKATNTGQSRQWRGCIFYPGGGATERMSAGYYETQTECGHAVDS
jgi:hypothetical protein